MIYGLSKLGIVWDLHMPTKKMIDNRLMRNKLAAQTASTTPEMS